MDPLQAIEYGSAACHICPNRVWEIGSRFDNWETQLPRLLRQYGGYIGQAIDAQDHAACTVEFCERSALNFTNVEQRHEPAHCHDPCYRLRGLFDERLLVTELSSPDRRPTAWALDGLSIVGPGQPFMAISHVWSDGTGMGVWAAGEVNACLFRYFEQIAVRFMCEGIWWDAVCLPNAKEARSIAVTNMDVNYQHAAVTLVHDCFLRGLPWTDDPSAACFAIIMSPWFSRGWTALELAKSPKVKIVFAEDTIVDLDADILDVVEAGDPAAESIRALRRPVEQLDDLLDILGSRHTSWTRDMAIIAGLLTGVGSASGAQREIYQAILLRFGQISHGHLFHKHATMSGTFSWCPTSLFQLPRAREGFRSSLQITREGDLRGTWKVVRLDSIPSEAYFWGNSHPLVERAMQSALATKNTCVLLVEPTATSAGRGILVKLWKHEEDSTKLKCQYLGSLFFHPGISLEHAPEVQTLIGDVQGWQLLSEQDDAWDMMQHQQQKHESPADMATKEHTGRPHLTKPLVLRRHSTSEHARDSKSNTKLTVRQSGHVALGQHDQQSPMVMARNRITEERKANQRVSSVRNRDGRTLLHWAAEVGDMQTFQLMLHTFTAEGASLAAADADGRNCLHLAIRAGRSGVVRVLLNLKLHLDMIRAQDILGQTALHLAVARNDPQVIQWLIDELDSATLRITDRFGGSALFLAARCLPGDIITAILQKYVADGSINVRDGSVKTALHDAVRSSNVKAIEFLMDCLPQETILAQTDTGENALHLAARQGDIQVLRALMKRWPSEHIAAMASFGENAVHLGLRAKDEAVIEFLVDCWPPEHITARTKSGLTALEAAAEYVGNVRVVEILLKRWGNELIAASHGSGQSTILERTIENSPEIFSLLAQRWPRDRRMFDKQTMTRILSQLAANHRPGYAEALNIALFEADAEEIVARTDMGQTLLHQAAANGNEDGLKYLLRFWPPKLLTVKTKWGDTALHLAAEGGHAGCVRQLTERWPAKSLATKTESGMTALHLAIFSGSVESVRVLVDSWPPKEVGANAASGTSIFDLAAQGKSMAVLKLLDERVPSRPRSMLFGRGHQEKHVVGETEEVTMQRILRERLPQADRDTVAWFTVAPLLEAASSGRTAEVQSLVERLPRDLIAGTTTAGETALHLAALGGHTKTVEALCRRWPVDQLAALTNAGFGALHMAVQNGNVEMAAVLMAHSPSIAAARADDGKTALHMAASRGDRAMMRLLLLRLSDDEVQMVDMRQLGVLEMAAESGNEACVHLLLQRPLLAKKTPEGATAPPAPMQWPLFRALGAAVRTGNEAMVRMLVGRHTRDQFSGIRDEVQFLAWDKTSSPVGAARGRVEAVLRLL